LNNTNLDHFDELKLHKLEYYAELWEKDCPDISIERIVLYKHHSKSTKKIKEKNPNLRGPQYVVAFEVSGVVLEPHTNRVSWDDKNQEEEDSFYKKIRDRYNSLDNIPFNIPDNIPNQDVLGCIEYNYVSDKGGVKKKAFEKACERAGLFENRKNFNYFENKRKFIYEMDNTPIAYRRESVFIYGYSGFKNVYKKQAGDNFYLDWYFIAVPPGGSLPDYVHKDVSMVLWGDEKQVLVG